MGKIIWAPSALKDIESIARYGAYRVMYRIAKDEIWITGVIHGARNWHPPIFKDNVPGGRG